MQERFEVSPSFKVWDNGVGTGFTVSEDADGLGLVQVSWGAEFADLGDSAGRVVMPSGMARKLADALWTMATHLEERKVLT
jgi:hypothetical protein